MDFHFHVSLIYHFLEFTTSTNSWNGLNGYTFMQVLWYYMGQGINYSLLSLFWTLAVFSVQANNSGFFSEKPIYCGLFSLVALILFLSGEKYQIDKITHYSNISWCNILGRKGYFPFKYLFHLYLKPGVSHLIATKLKMCIYSKHQHQNFMHIPLKNIPVSITPIQ